MKAVEEKLKTNLLRTTSDELVVKKKLSEGYQEYFG